MFPAYLGARWTLENLAYHRPEFFDWNNTKPVAKPAIFVSNHPGSIDPGVLAAHIRKDLGEAAFFMVMHKVGAVFIDPMLAFKWFRFITIKENNRSSCLPQILDVLNRGYRLFVFPRGKLDYGQPLDMKTTQNGISLIVHRAGVPVYPIGYYGPPNISRTFREFLKGVFGKHPVRVKVGKPLYFEKIESRIRKKRILETKERIITQINSLVDEIRD